MIIRKLTLKNAYKIICLFFSWMSSFYFPNKITGLNELSKKNKNKIKLIQPENQLTTKTRESTNHKNFFCVIKVELTTNSVGIRAFFCRNNALFKKKNFKFYNDCRE